MSLEGANCRLCLEVISLTHAWCFDPYTTVLGSFGVNIGPLQRGFFKSSCMVYQLLLYTQTNQYILGSNSKANLWCITQSFKGLFWCGVVAIVSFLYLCKFTNLSLETTMIQSLRI